MARRSIGWSLLAALVAALPFLVRPYHLDILIFLEINILVVASYRLMTITGEWSLAHVVLMGVGAYASALLAKRLGLPFWVSMPAAALVAGVLAYALSFPLFRMKGFYFLIGSFAASEAIRLVWIRFQDPFGGPKGVTLIPPPEIDLPGFGTIGLGQPVRFYFLALAVVGLCLWVMHRIERSRIGLTLHAIHWRDVLAESVGVDTRRYRTLAFIAASFFVAVAGALLAHYVGGVRPSQFALHNMLYVLVWVIVGGTRTPFGPIVGVTLLTIVDEFIREFGQYRPLIYGVILIVTVRFLPTGLESLPARLLALRRPPAAS
ncbi:MAG: branched-chain amino acid ABC transporter permease [Dongiaceae bacterium]